jgi:hypothetical protein
MTLTTTTAAQVIRTKSESGFVDAVFRNNSFLMYFGAPAAQGGDTNIRWKVNSAGNTSTEVFTEGLPQPAAGNQSYVTAAVAPNYFRAMLQITGHARDALQSAWFDAIAEETLLARADVVDLITTTAMSGTNGIETMIDSTTTYAGIARGAAAYWESTETAVAGPLAVSDLEDLLETIRDNDKGGNPTHIFGPLNQVTNFARLSGTPYVQNGGPADKGQHLMGPSFAGRPFIGLPDFTNDVIVMADMRPGNFGMYQQRAWDVKAMAPSGDSDVMQLSWAGLPICRQPKFQGKLTGVTA